MLSVSVYVSVSVCLSGSRDGVASGRDVLSVSVSVSVCLSESRDGVASGRDMLSVSVYVSVCLSVRVPRWRCIGA